MYEDTQNTQANDSVVSTQRSWLQVALVAVLTAALTLGGTWAFGAYDHTEIPPLDQQLSDGQFDSDLILAEMAGTDLSTLSEFVRPVSVDAVLYYTQEQVLELYNRQVEQILAQVDATYGEEIPEDVAANLPEIAQSFDDLPQRIKDGFNSDGLFPQQVASGSVNGFLVNGKVAVPSQVFAQIFQQPAELGKSIQVDVKILANPDVEDQWKEEVLFSGSAVDLVQVLDTHSEIGLSFLARPDNNVLVASDDVPYEAVAGIEELKSTQKVVYGTTQMTATASVLHVLTDRNLVLIKGAFSGQEIGMPVFTLRDGNLVWAGIIVSFSDSHIAIVASADSVQTRSEGGNK